MSLTCFIITLCLRASVYKEACVNTAHTIHTGITGCNDCNFLFLPQHDHMKPFQCEVCNRGYNTAAALTSHMQNHKRNGKIKSVNGNITSDKNHITTNNTSSITSSQEQQGDNDKTTSVNGYDITSDKNHITSNSISSIASSQEHQGEGTSAKKVFIFFFFLALICYVINYRHKIHCQAAYPIKEWHTNLPIFGKVKTVEYYVF